MSTRNDRLLTPADLAERWSCDEATVLEHVREDGLTFIPVGKIPRDPSTPGQKSYRFRLADVEQWEERRRMSWNKPDLPPQAAPPVPAAVAPELAPPLPGIPGWDRKIRGGSRPRKPRATS